MLADLPMVGFLRENGERLRRAANQPKQRKQERGENHQRLKRQFGDHRPEWSRSTAADREPRAVVHPDGDDQDLASAQTGLEGSLHFRHAAR